jgi:hypothetical protein
LTLRFNARRFTPTLAVWHRVSWQLPRTGLTPASNDELTNKDHLHDNLQSAARTNASTTRHSSKEDAAGDERLDCVGELRQAPALVDVCRSAGNEVEFFPGADRGAVGDQRRGARVLGVT